MNQIPNIEEAKLAGKVVICDGLYTGKVGTILGTGSSQYSIKLLVDGLERYEPDYALLHVTEDNEQAVKLLLTHNHQLQKAREEERERIIYITKNIKDAFMSPLTERRWLQCIQFTDQPKPKDQSELDQPNK